MTNQTENFFASIFGADSAEDAAANAVTRAQMATNQDAKLAASGLSVGQVVMWDGIAWTILGMVGTDAVQLHTTHAGRAGFANAPVAEIAG